LGRVIAAVSSLCVRRLAGSFEAQRTRLALSYRPIFSSPYKGPCGLLIRIWAGSKSTAGKCFSLCVAFIDHCREPFDRIAYGLSFPPVLSFVPINHAHKKAWSWTHDEHGNSANRAIGVKSNV
jgi:hypothetical protein